MDYGKVIKVKNVSEVSENLQKGFSNEMQKYSGRCGKIVGIEVAVSEGVKFPVYKIDADNGIFFWREEFLEII